jgi:uncharacterized protein YlxW (UPF0749 family)
VTPSQKPDAERLVSARLLTELVDNPLDPGYAAAAGRRGPDAPRRWYDRPAVVVGCLLIGFVLVVAYVHTHRGAPAAAKVHDSLVARVRAAQQNGAELADRVGTLEEQLAAAQGKALPKASAAELQRAKADAGQIAVTGPGITVTLSEPPVATASPATGRGGTTPIEATNILTDRDVRSVANELWHDGAEAIDVNEVRLTPTSAIRFAGQVVLVDRQTVVPPYRISAVGESDQLSTNFAQSAVASRYQTLQSAEGIGFSFSESDHLSLPGSEPVVPQYAKVAKPGHR